MDLTVLLRPEIQQFIHEQSGCDTRTLLLKHKVILGIPATLVADQIEGRKKAQGKLPAWYRSEVIYPPSVNLEQCSSQATASLKSGLIGKLCKKLDTLGDLTAGFGVDSFFLAQTAKEFHCVEPNASLCEIMSINHHVLQQTASTKTPRFIYHPEKAEEFIKKTKTSFDLLFIDPSRRTKTAKRTVRFMDCLPDITSLQASLFNKCHYLLLKASPLLDIMQGLRELEHVKHVFVVSVNNECKELLFFADRNFNGEPSVQAYELDSIGDAKDTFAFTFSEEKMSKVVYGDPGQFLYEPYTSILKAGAFKSIAERFKLNKLHPNTHLYTSNSLIKEFAGKIFKVESLNPDAADIKKYLPEGMANITTRNYPLTPDEILKQHKIKEGGRLFLIGFSGQRKKYLAVATRIK